MNPATRRLQTIDGDRLRKNIVKFDLRFIIVKRILVKHNLNLQSMDVAMREKAN